MFYIYHFSVFSSEITHLFLFCIATVSPIASHGFSYPWWITIYKYYLQKISNPPKFIHCFYYTPFRIAWWNLTYFYSMLPGMWSNSLCYLCTLHMLISHWSFSSFLGYQINCCANISTQVTLNPTEPLIQPWNPTEVLLLIWTLKGWKIVSLKWKGKTFAGFIMKEKFSFMAMLWWVTFVSTLLCVIPKLNFIIDVQTQEK